MKANTKSGRGPRQARAGFSLVEVMVAIVVFGLTAVALYAGVTFGFNSVQIARENLRATQILAEKMEIIRLYNWDEINEAGFIPTTFEAKYAPGGTATTTGPNGKETISTAEGVTYYGTITVTNAGLSENYRLKVKRVNLTVKWTTGKIERSRSLSTLVTEDGLQSYVY